MTWNEVKYPNVQSELWKDSFRPVRIRFEFITTRSKRRRFYKQLHFWGRERVIYAGSWDIRKIVSEALVDFEEIEEEFGCQNMMIL